MLHLMPQKHLPEWWEKEEQGFVLCVSSDLNHVVTSSQFTLCKIKGIVSDSNNIFLWYESEDINKESLFPKFHLIPILRFQVMYDYAFFTAPIDYCVE